jgi:hypothetical protein
MAPAPASGGQPAYRLRLFSCQIQRTLRIATITKSWAINRPSSTLGTCRRQRSGATGAHEHAANCVKPASCSVRFRKSSRRSAARCPIGATKPPVRHHLAAQCLPNMRATAWWTGIPAAVPTEAMVETPLSVANGRAGGRRFRGRLRRPRRAASAARRWRRGHPCRRRVGAWVSPGRPRRLRSPRGPSRRDRPRRAACRAPARRVAAAVACRRARSGRRSRAAAAVRASPIRSSASTRGPALPGRASGGRRGESPPVAPFRAAR